ncbi:type II toxin-antitoxin system RelE/ParE family toxin [Shewanella metallivivens]|uniref:Type II toxin-antitoxin system RelE/ParE family toxin n=1 Tax=Shewanella metallivivens TaxID=2872342 RepID=A0ABT5TNU0_9GAMM|nr:type II toxin-antitoxin system RelE/ParE family toxin [Shewanella metallivivens]
MGRIFKTPDFTSWAKDESVDDSALLTAVQEIENGLIDAKLGGNVIKKRIARTDQGKSGGFRTIIAFKVDDKSFFMFGFSKNEKANISAKEKTALKIMAKELLAYDNKQLAKALKHKALFEVIRDE